MVISLEALLFAGFAENKKYLMRDQFFSFKDITHFSIVRDNQYTREKLLQPCSTYIKRYFVYVVLPFKS